MASGTRDPLESAHLAFFAHFRDRMHWLSTETQVLATNVSRPPLSSANGGYARSLLEREVTCNVDELRKRVRTLREHVAVAPAAQMLTEAQALYERNEASLVATERALEAYGYVRPPKPPTPVRRPVAPSPPPPPREPELPPSPTMEAAHAGAEADLYDHDLYEPHPADASPPYARAAGGGYGRDGQSGAADENLPPSPGLSLESLGLSDAALRVVACGTSVALAARASPGPKPPSAQPAGAFDLLASLEPPPSAADRRAAVSPADLLSFGSSPAARREYTPQSPPYGVAEPTGPSRMSELEGLEMSAAADAHRSAHAHASPARAAAHAAPAAGWLGASASLDELPSPPSLSPLRTTGVMPAAAATGALPAAAASRLVATAAASMSEGWSPSASPPLCAISAQPRASAATAAGADAPSLALTNRIELLPISPAEFGRAPSYLRSEFDFMQLNEYLARISHAIAQRAAALRAGAVDLALDVWTAEALASATGLSPLNAPADGGGGSQSEPCVKALLLFLTHTGRALAERQGTLATCYRLVLQ